MEVAVFLLVLGAIIVISLWVTVFRMNSDQIQKNNSQNLSLYQKEKRPKGKCPWVNAYQPVKEMVRTSACSPVAKKSSNVQVTFRPFSTLLEITLPRR